MGQRTPNRTGWSLLEPGDDPSLLEDTAVGLLAMSGDLVVPQEPAWSGATFFTVPGLFNNTAVIKNNGGGEIEVLRDGLYMLAAYGTNANTQATSTMNVRFTKNGVLIPNSNHQIYENATDNDRDMISKGVPVVLVSGDKVKCEFNSSDTATTLKGDATWMISLSTGVQGATGPIGNSSFETDEFSVFRNTTPTNQDLTKERNIFYNQYIVSGTISGAIGSPNIVGVGTTFLADVSISGIIEVTDDGGVQRFYKVLSITDNLNLVLAENVIDTITGKAWFYYTVKNTALYNVNTKYDVTKSLWKPDAGKYVVSACGAFDLVGDTNWVYIYLYNVTTNTIVAIGGRGRNAGNGQFNSILACQISANGTDEYAIFCLSNDTSVNIYGIEIYYTYFMAYKLSVTP